MDYGDKLPPSPQYIFTPPRRYIFTPPLTNRCWFAGRVLQVKRAYGLTVDRREAAALERILQGCASTAMEPMVCRAAPAPAGDTGRGAGGDDVLARYDDNRNGRITCKEARRHAIAPVQTTT